MPLNRIYFISIFVISIAYFQYSLFLKDLGCVYGCGVTKKALCSDFS